jgi:hypothetical protein
MHPGYPATVIRGEISGRNGQPGGDDRKNENQSLNIRLLLQKEISA